MTKLANKSLPGLLGISMIIEPSVPIMCPVIGHPEMFYFACLQEYKFVTMQNKFVNKNLKCFSKNTVLNNNYKFVNMKCMFNGNNYKFIDKI